LQFGSRSLRRALSVVADVTLLGVLAVVLSLLASPGGPLRSAWADWRATRSVAEQIRQHWGRLTNDGTFLGSPQAEPRLVVFLDYECPYCRSAHEPTADFLQQHPDVRVVVRHLPLTELHPSARSAALAAVCADAQGRFGEMHDFLMRTEHWRSNPEWPAIAEEVGLRDVPGFVMCLGSDAAKGRLEADLELARLLGVSATPFHASRRSVQAGGPITPDLLAELAGVES